MLAWSSTRIDCLITRPQPAGDYVVTVSIKGNNHATQLMMFYPFTVRPPRVIPPDPPRLVPEGKIFTIAGVFFGDKRGELTLVSRRGNTTRAAVADWKMDAIRFTIHPDFRETVCALKVSNAVGEGMYIHPDCLTEGIPCYDSWSDPPPGYWGKDAFFQNNSSGIYYAGVFYHFTIAWIPMLTF